MSATIKDVAAKVGVSPMTVSRAYSGNHPVAEETKKRVFAAAKALGYVPHLGARALVSKHNPMIGVIVVSLSNPFFAPVMDAIQEIAHQEGYFTVFNQSKFDPELEQANLQQFQQMRMAGALVVSVSPNLDHLQKMRESGLLVVSMARSWEEGDYVAADYYRGGYLAGEHLCKLNHQHIVCVAHDELFQGGLYDRIQGFKAALDSFQFPFQDSDMILTKSVGVRAGVDAADRFLQLPKRPSAAFVTSDHIAVGFIHRLLEQGLRVPEDVAVVSYDDIRYAGFMEVPLTTVALPKYEIGELGAKILFDRIKATEKDETLQQVLLEPQLIVRASCGAK